MSRRPVDESLESEIPHLQSGRQCSEGLRLGASQNDAVFKRDLSVPCMVHRIAALIKVIAIDGTDAVSHCIDIGIHAVSTDRSTEDTVLRKYRHLIGLESHISRDIPVDQPCVYDSCGQVQFYSPVVNDILRHAVQLPVGISPPSGLLGTHSEIID